MKIANVSLQVAGCTNQMTKNIYVFDFETDPFKWERIPEVFCVGVYDGQIFNYHWGDQDSCISFLCDCMGVAPAGSIFYAHNGGKFDFHFFKDRIRGKVQLIGSRIAKCYVDNVELRDSYSLLPFALDKYQKTKIDYEWFEKENRDKHKDAILSYLKDDCVFLHQLVTGFVDEFGMSLTAAGAAMKEFKKFHEFERMGNPERDAKYREYFYGGRVECLKKGVLEGNFHVYDVNSMYPSVMRNFEHPVSNDVITYSGRQLNNSIEHCDFIEVEGENFGAFPARTKSGLSFNQDYGRFKVTGHEIRAALETGRFRIAKVHQSFRATERMKFENFIDHFFNSRLRAKEEGNKLLDLFYKLIMNSSYGKFAQNPEDFRDYELTHEVKSTSDGWVLEHEFQGSNPPLFIWSIASQRPEHLSRFNVMTAASITGAARAQLMRGLHASINPLYCDTDSIICEGLAGDLDDSRLGAWKTEASGTKLAIAGKKMYVLFDANGEVVKQASKGVRISASDIVKVAKGKAIKYRNIAPTFSFVDKTRFIEREIKRTA